MNLDFFRQQNVSESLMKDIDNFRKQYPVEKEMQVRIPIPPIPFYGKEILEMSIATLLKGENLLLSGGKATGKNILAENLAYIFGRPSYNISFHVNVDSAALIGTDTFIDNEVRLRKGMVTLCAEQGGFAVFDEINMAKNDAVSVLHAALDYRGIIDIPGYDRIELHPATRFIGTMNYGYAGTKELNEALVSRFMVINMPKQDEETVKLILEEYEDGIYFTTNTPSRAASLLSPTQTLNSPGSCANSSFMVQNDISSGVISNSIVRSSPERSSTRSKPFNSFTGRVTDE